MLSASHVRRAPLRSMTVHPQAKPSALRMPLRPTEARMTMLSAGHVCRAPLRSVTVQPQAKLSVVHMPLRPTEARMSSHPGARDRLTTDRVPLTLHLTYKLTLAEAGKVTPRLPLLNKCAPAAGTRRLSPPDLEPQTGLAAATRGPRAHAGTGRQGHSHAAGAHVATAPRPPASSVHGPQPTAPDLDPHTGRGRQSRGMPKGAHGRALTAPTALTAPRAAQPCVRERDGGPDVHAARRQQAPPGLRGHQAPGGPAGQGRVRHPRRAAPRRPRPAGQARPPRLCLRERRVAGLGLAPVQAARPQTSQRSQRCAWKGVPLPRWRTRCAGPPPLVLCSLQACLGIAHQPLYTGDQDCLRAAYCMLHWALQPQGEPLKRGAARWRPAAGGPCAPVRG